MSIDSSFAGGHLLKYPVEALLIEAHTQSTHVGVLVEPVQHIFPRHGRQFVDPLSGVSLLPRVGMERLLRLRATSEKRIKISEQEIHLGFVDDRCRQPLHLQI